MFNSWILPDFYMQYEHLLLSTVLVVTWFIQVNTIKQTHCHLVKLRILWDSEVNAGTVETVVGESLFLTGSLFQVNVKKWK